MPAGVSPREECKRALQEDGLEAGSDDEWTRPLAVRGPADLRYREASAAMAGAGQERPNPLDLRPEHRDGLRVRVKSDEVETVPDSGDREELAQKCRPGHAIPDGGDTREHDLRLGIHRAQRLRRELHQVAVGPRGLRRFPIGREVRLVPDLPAPDRRLRPVREEAAARAIAARERGEELLPRRPLAGLRERGMILVLVDPRRDAVDEGQQADPVGLRLRDYGVDAAPVVDARLWLHHTPADEKAQRLHASRLHAVEVGWREGSLIDDPKGWPGVCRAGRRHETDGSATDQDRQALHCRFKPPARHVVADSLPSRLQ